MGAHQGHPHPPPPLRPAPGASPTQTAPPKRVARRPNQRPQGRRQGRVPHTAPAQSGLRRWYGSDGRTGRKLGPRRDVGPPSVRNKPTLEPSAPSVTRAGRGTASRRKCGTDSGSHSLRHTRCTRPGPSGECGVLRHAPRGAGTPRGCRAASRGAAAAREPAFEGPPPGRPDAAPMGGRRAWPGGGGPPMRPPARPPRHAQRRGPAARATPNGRAAAAPGRKGATPRQPTRPPPGCQASQAGSAPGGRGRGGGTGPIGPPDLPPCRSNRGTPRGPHGAP
jgi:hypothetical protein